MSGEAEFRHGKVDPFIRTLDNCAGFSIQQQSIRGDFDKVLCIRGFFVGMELKDAGGKLSALQEYKASQVRKSGGIAICARPQNWDMVKYFLSQLDAGIFDKQMLLDINKEELNDKNPL